MKALDKSFISFIHGESLFTPGNRLLVGVSGGLDSTVCCALLRANGYFFEMAHVNFQLRGAESNRDQEFVQQLADRWEVPLHQMTVDTAALAAEKSLSIQEMAREIRYNWFEQLVSARDGKTFDAIITAHHADDNVETVLFNLFRGTGLDGLKGILPKRGRIRRPLLFARRLELEQYAMEHKLAWVEDSSNQSDKYSRNFLRLNVLPALEKQFPAISANIALSAAHLREVKAFYDAAITKTVSRMIKKEAGAEKIAVLQLQQQPGGKAILYSWLQPHGFSSDQILAAWHLCNSQTGSFIDAQNVRLLRNRNWLLLQPLDSLENAIYLLESASGSLNFGGFELRWSEKNYTNETIPANQELAWLDSSSIQYPIILRRWKAGDYFYPLGMPKKKKVARFLIDQKLSRPAKENTWILESGKKIIWIVGQRVDDRFKINAATKRVVRFTIKKT